MSFLFWGEQIILIFLLIHRGIMQWCEHWTVLGHTSARSFATGPMMAEPLISPLLFTVAPFAEHKLSSFM